MTFLLDLQGIGVKFSVDSLNFFQDNEMTKYYLGPIDHVCEFATHNSGKHTTLLLANALYAVLSLLYAWTCM